MAMQVRSAKFIFLVGNINHQITGAKLPSKRQVLEVLFYNIREVKLTVSESSNLVIRECLIFWEKARIPTKALPHCIKKLVKLYELWKDLQKNSKKTQDIFKRREEEFQSDLDNLFDLAHADALAKIKIEEDKMFLLHQREPGRPGCLIGVDKKLMEKEERAKQRILGEENRLRKLTIPSSSTGSTGCLLYQQLGNETDTSSNSAESHGEHLPTTTETKTVQSESLKKRGRKEFLTAKLVSVLDRCQLSIRDSVYILQATVEAIGLNFEDFPINKSSIQRVRTQMRKKRAASIKTDFGNDVPEVVTVHWDGKLLPGLTVRSCKEERLPIVITFGSKEQLLSVPKLENSSGKEQSAAVFRAINDWNLESKVQIMCCDTTASNTGRFNGACVLLEQRLERELLLFGCRHHIYELVLKSVFETKIRQVTISPDIPLFKKFRENWKNIDSSTVQTCSETIRKHFRETTINELLDFYSAELQKTIVRDDYRELIELSVMFLGGNKNRELKIRPPGAMHQARWMARAIYSLKIYLLQSQHKLSKQERQGLEDICLFITTTYVRPWLQCNLAVKAPFQDLDFIKTLKNYERIDSAISSAALNKFCQHLYYFTEEIVVLSLFDDIVDVETKTRMVNNLTKDGSLDSFKRYVPSKDELRCSLYGRVFF